MRTASTRRKKYPSKTQKNQRSPLRARLVEANAVVTKRNRAPFGDGKNTSPPCVEYSSWLRNSPGNLLSVVLADAGFCSPSRSSLLSGRLPYHVNQYNNGGEALGA